jgi:tRNA1(Val) A37 N6-methylase TrmN6
MEKEKHFNDVVNIYNSFYKFLYVKHKQFPIKDTKIGFWGVAPSKDVFDFFKTIKLENYSHLIDLGSGDGKIALIASLFTNSTGIEYDKWLHTVSLDIKDKLYHVPLTKRTRFINDDFMKHNFSNYDIAFLNPDKTTKEIKNKLMDEFKGRLVVFGNHDKHLNEEEKLEINGSLFTIYNFSNKF